MTRFITPPHVSAWEPIDPAAELSSAPTAQNQDEYADVWYRAYELWEASEKSRELDQAIASERQQLSLSNLKAKLDKFDRDMDSMKRQPQRTTDTNGRIEMSNGRPDDLSDPKYLRAAGGSVPDEPAWQRERRAEEARNLAHTRSVGERAGTGARAGTVRKHEEVDLASVRASSGVIQPQDMSNPNLPGAPTHEESHEFDNHRFMDGTSPAEVFIERHGWKLQSGYGAGK